MESSVSARNPMFSSINKMDSGYARSLGEILIWVSISHMKHASIQVINLIYLDRNHFLGQWPVKGLWHHHENFFSGRGPTYTPQSPEIHP